jgi:hypothetical protein
MSLADITSNLRADIQTSVDDKPMVKVHAVEWAKVMRGDPVEINPSVGHGYKVSRGPGEQFILQCGAGLS